MKDQKKRLPEGEAAVVIVLHVKDNYRQLTNYPLSGSGVRLNTLLNTTLKLGDAGRSFVKALKVLASPRWRLGLGSRLSFYCSGFPSGYLI